MASSRSSPTASCQSPAARYSRTSPPPLPWYTRAPHRHTSGTPSYYYRTPTLRRAAPRRRAASRSTSLSLPDQNRSETMWWVDVVTPEYKSLRRRVTAKYGWVTLIVCVAFVAFVMARRRPPQAQAAAAFWCCAGLALSFAESHSDLLFVTKRMGRVSATLVPLVLLLALRPSIIRRQVHLELLPTHKWLARVVALLAVAHTALYCWYYVRAHTVAKLWNRTNLFGWAALVAMFALAVCSLRPIRRRNYAFFFTCHYVGAWALAVCMFFHAKPPLRFVSALNVSFLAAQVCFRVLHTTVATARVDSYCGLKIVKLGPALPTDSPLAHVRVRAKHHGFWANLWAWIVPLEHPYTVATSESSELVLVVRESRFVFSSCAAYYVSGPYEQNVPFIRCNNEAQIGSDERLLLPRGHSHSHGLGLDPRFSVCASRVLIISGGSGIAAVTPILEILHKNEIPVRVLWAVRSITETYVLKQLNVATRDFEVYVTRSKHRGTTDSVKTYPGRPKLGSSDLQWCDTGTWVMGVGPSTLVAHAREWALENGLQFYGEEFEI